MNAGPNASTFSLAAELFPTQLRSTASGFAAGFAKIGAALGIFILPLLKSHFGISIVLISLACISLAGMLITFLYAQKIKEGENLEAYQRLHQT